MEQIHAKCSVDGKPPCLEDVLELYSRQAFLNIEVKVRGMEQVVLNAIKRFPPQRGYFISSFLPSVVRKLYALDRSLVLGAISKSYWHLRRWKTLPVSYVVPHFSLLTQKLVDELHAAGKTVITWTINDPSKMFKPLQWGWTESSPTIRSCWCTRSSTDLCVDTVQVHNRAMGFRVS